MLTAPPLPLEFEPTETQVPAVGQATLPSESSPATGPLAAVGLAAVLAVAAVLAGAAVAAAGIPMIPMVDRMAITAVTHRDL
jgi:hypothetical protein